MATSEIISCPNFMSLSILYPYFKCCELCDVTYMIRDLIRNYNIGLLIITNDLSLIDLLLLFKFDFGDIIKFKRKIGPVSFNHYVIYVDDQDIEGKLPGQDIFHFSGKFTKVSIKHKPFKSFMLNISTTLLMKSIFPLSGEMNNKQYADCVFGKLEEVTEDSTAEKQNYRDYEDEVMNYQDMVNKITTFHKNCQRQYRVVSANCEHLVTVIRYGSATCRQVSLFL